jgi:peptide deformylase
MTILNLVKESDETLKQTSSDWDWETDGEIAEFAQNMLKLMFENNGIGLAAPQVGVNKRVFVMGNQQRSYICVNPEVTGTSGSKRDLEGCLSFPGLWLNVERPETITVKYQDILGRVQEHEFTGLAARVFQHELDHLNGVCFVNKVGKLSLDLATKRRKKNLKRK